VVIKQRANCASMPYSTMSYYNKNAQYTTTQENYIASTKSHIAASHWLQVATWTVSHFPYVNTSSALDGSKIVISGCKVYEGACIARTALRIRNCFMQALSSRRKLSMMEQSQSSESHCHAICVASGNHLSIGHRATWLCNKLDTQL